MSETFPLAAISAISEPEKIRVVLFINQQMVHAPLLALLQPLLDRIADLEERVTDLETP